jgi:hypothetical protein
MEDKSMSTADEGVKILTVASCSFVRDEHRSHVVVSGSYGGRYNAFNAAKWGVRGVIMNDAGVGKDNAGILGLGFLDQINLAAATADAQTCHIGDGDHMLEHGIISHVNRAAAALGCTPGQSVRDCAALMRSAIVPAAAPPSITEGARFVMRDVPGEPRLICADSVGMLQPDDAGQIAVRVTWRPFRRSAGQRYPAGDLRRVLQRCRRWDGRGGYRAAGRSRPERDRRRHDLCRQRPDRRFTRALP